MTTPLERSSAGPAAKPASLFLTGCYRSGTSLLEKLLHMQSGVCLASQPFPALYFHCKEAFLRSRGLPRRYPLDHLFLERDYGRRDFRDFLDEHVLDESDIEAIFKQLDGYPGWGTPQLQADQERIRPGRFIDVYGQFNSRLPRLLGKGDERLRFIGGKEVLAEEFIPHLIVQGSKVVLIVRDPRDVITSLNFGQRASHTGGCRPVLYSLRVWRKSIAFTLGCQEDPNFFWLRYEDLVRQPDATLSRLCQQLELPEADLSSLRGGLRDQSGQAWRGNSSFAEWTGVSAHAAGRFESTLPETVLEYIESCCMPEMKAVNYPLAGSGVFSEESLRQFQEPVPVDHPKFAPDYSSSSERLEEELERHRHLRSGADGMATKEMESWFIHAGAYPKLRQVYS